MDDFAIWLVNSLENSNLVGAQKGKHSRLHQASILFRLDYGCSSFATLEIRIHSVIVESFNKHRKKHIARVCTYTEKSQSSGAHSVTILPFRILLAQLPSYTCVLSQPLKRELVYMQSSLTLQALCFAF